MAGNRGKSHLRTSKSKDLTLQNPQKSNAGIFKRSQSVSTLKESYNNPEREAQALKIRAMVKEKMSHLKLLSSQGSEIEKAIPMLEAQVLLTPLPRNSCTDT
jgi:hypothetical protein